MEAFVVEELLDEVRLLGHALSQSIERLYKHEGITPGMRTVLGFLAQHGPATVPQIARSRDFTRQHIQVLVDALLERDLAVREANPSHRRSTLVRLTPHGAKVNERLRKRELEVFERLGLGAERMDLRRVARTLTEIRSAIRRAA